MRKVMLCKRKGLPVILAGVLLLAVTSSAFAVSQWVFQAESDLAHLIGRADGAGWSANVASDWSDWLCYGPYTQVISTGPYRASFRMMIDSCSGANELVASVDVHDTTTNTVLAGRNIYRHEFQANMTYQDFDLRFTATSGHTYQFRTIWYDKAYINEDRVLVTGQKFEAEADFAHLIGRADGAGWSASTLSDWIDWLCYGPYTTAVCAGPNRVSFKMMIDSCTGTNDLVAYIDVFEDAAGIIASRYIYRNEFQADLTYQDFDLGFNAISGTYQFRTVWYDNAYINEDCVTLGSRNLTIYNLDLRNTAGLTAQQIYDIRHAAVCVQGLVNRTAPRVFLQFVDQDATWLDRIRESGGLCEGWQVRNVGDVYELLSLFSNYCNGVVLYDADPFTCVTSTSLVATTAAAVEGAIAIRKDTTAGSMYNYLVNDASGPQLPVLIDLTGKFTGTGTIWQTSTPSTGSAKCDAYIWAKQKYIDTGRCDPTVLSYTLDEWALRAGLGASSKAQLSNLDYAVSRRGFCFELSPWGDEVPNDDPTQPPGTDLATYKSILDACNVQTGQGEMMKFCGFPNWDIKYTNWVGGSHTDVETEWETARICSAYNTYIEAEAPDPRWISNASFYAGLLPGFKDRRCVQNPAPTYDDMVSRGLIDGSGNVIAGNYILEGLGDYDQAAWTLYNLASIGGTYDDPNRGEVYCSWGLNPNAVDRGCVAVDYIYRHKTPSDYFISWDSGAGYLNPGQLYGTRDPSGYPSAVSVWQKHCKDYYRTLDYSISGWLLNGASTITTTDLNNYVPFSGDGIGTYEWVSFTSPSLWNNTPAQILNLGGIIDYPTGVNFAWYRTVGETPTQIKATADSYASSGHHHVFMDAYTYYYLLRYYLGGDNSYRATWVEDTIPRIMAAGHTYSVTVTVRNDGWDTWSEASMYRLAHAVVASGVVPAYGDYDSNGRHYLPNNVAPGESVTFSFNITAPGANGYYDLCYDIVRDGVAWFREQNNIEWKKPIIVSTNETDIDTDTDGIPDVTEAAIGTLYWHPDDGAPPAADTLPPTGSLTINSGAAYTSSANVTLTLFATDNGSGVAQMSFSNDGVNWSSWEAYNTSKAWTLTSGDGTKTVYAEFKDVAGNISAACIDTIILDTSPPASGICTPHAGVTTGTIIVPYSGVSDSGSGLAFVELWYKKETGGTWTNSGLTQTGASGSFTFTPSSGSGRYYFDLVAQDNLGNRSAAASGSGDGVTIFKLWWSDGFESGNFTAGGWTNSGCNITSTYKYSGTYAAQFNSSDSLTKLYSTSGKSNIIVEYGRYTRLMESDDHFISEWSTNGTTWTTLEDLTGNNAWAVKQYSLPTGADNQSGFRIRFRTSHNGSTDYAYLDDVKVIGL